VIGALLLDIVSDVLDADNPPRFVIHGSSRQRTVVEIATEAHFFDDRWANRRPENFLSSAVRGRPIVLDDSGQLLFQVAEEDWTALLSSGGSRFWARIFSVQPLAHMPSAVIAFDVAGAGSRAQAKGAAQSGCRGLTPEGIQAEAPTSPGRGSRTSPSSGVQPAVQAPKILPAASQVAGNVGQPLDAAGDARDNDFVGVRAGLPRGMGRREKDMADRIDVSTLDLEDLERIQSDVVRTLAQRALSRADQLAEYDSHSSSHSKNSVALSALERSARRGKVS